MAVESANIKDAKGRDFYRYGRRGASKWSTLPRRKRRRTTMNTEGLEERFGGRVGGGE